MGIFMHTNGQRVDFKAVRSATLSALDFVVPQLLPGGRQESGEWVARNPTRNDAKPGSFKVNLKSGVWCDFATGDKGGDVIGLKAYLEGKSRVEAAQELATMLNVQSTDATNLTGNVRDHQSKSTPQVAATPAEAKDRPADFPAPTKPDEEGKPRFMPAGDEGPRLREDEKRRHIYKRGGVPVRIKIMTRGDRRAFNAYRVTDVHGRTGWQYRKPEGFRSVPYLAGDLDGSSTVYWPEGEKDVDSVGKRGGCAVTFGGVGDGLPAGCEQYFANKHLVILADNDEEGSDHAEVKAALAFGVATSVRVVGFPELEKKQDVSDWFEAGHTLQDLEERMLTTEEWQPSTEQLDEGERHLHAGAEKKSSLPVGYSFSDRGLMWSNPDDLDKPAVLVAGHFDVLAETRDPDGASWGVLLHWKDHDGRDHQFALPRATLAGDGSEARRILMDGGFFISPGHVPRSAWAGMATHLSCLASASAPIRAISCCCRVHPPTSTRSGRRERSRVGNRMWRSKPSVTAGWCRRCRRPSLDRSSARVRWKAGVSTSRALRPLARAQRCMLPVAYGVVAMRTATSGPGAQQRTGWRAFLWRTATRCCVWTSCLSWRPRMQERPPTCSLTARASRAARATAQREELPSGGFCFCRPAKSGCPTRSPRMAAANV